MSQPFLADTEHVVVDNNTPHPYTTPLPKLQLGILCSIRLMDPLTFTQIFPYINEFLERLHLVEDPSGIGFYSGLVESTFAFFQLISIYEWAKVSEWAGRRPVIVGSTFGLALATVLLGFTSKLWTMLLSRALAGFFAGNAAVLHSMLGELTDSTNQHIAFPLYGLFWPLGSIIGPIIGGALANPSRQLPSPIFRSAFFEKWPYFLPCFTTGALAFLTACTAAAFLRETHPAYRPHLKDDQETALHRSLSFVSIPKDHTALTVKEILQIPTIRALGLSGASLCFSATAFDAVFVLFAYTTVTEGGLEFTTKQIGYALAIAGASSILIQVLLLPTMLRKFRAAKVYNFCMWMWPLCYLALPFLHLSVASPWLLWAAIALLLSVSRVACLAYSVSMVLVKENSPSPFALAQSNGLVLFAMCLSRAFAPAFVSSTYAFSLQHHVMGGYLWTIVMASLSLLGCSLSRSIEQPERRIQLV